MSSGDESDFDEVNLTNSGSSDAADDEHDDDFDAYLNGDPSLVELGEHPGSPIEIDDNDEDSDDEASDEASNDDDPETDEEIEEESQNEGVVAVSSRPRSSRGSPSNHSSNDGDESDGDDFEEAPPDGFNGPPNNGTPLHNEGGSGPPSDDGSDSDSSGFDSSGSGDEAEDALGAPGDLHWPTEKCLDICKPRFMQLREQYHMLRVRMRHAERRLLHYKGRRREHLRTIKELKEKVKAFEKKQVKKTKETWSTSLQEHLQPQPVANAEAEAGNETDEPVEVEAPRGLNPHQWQQLYILACREGNMSPQICMTHPALKLRPALQSDRDQARLRSELYAEVTVQGAQVQTQLPNLPSRVQLEILRHALVFDETIHVLSRLDQYERPREMSDVALDRNGKPTFFSRFFIGNSGQSTSVKYAPDPNQLLAVLSGRFASGIGARLQIVQHIELLWTGSQHLTFESKGSKGKSVSRRTHCLAWLSEALRLKTVNIFIQESAKTMRRRINEPKGCARYLEYRTRLQPNCRRFRALRHLQGLDYLHTLRGLDQIEFFDYDMWTTRKQIQEVRDWSFVQDVNNSVRRPKHEHEREESERRNLAPLTSSRYTLSEVDWVLLENMLEGRPQVPYFPDVHSSVSAADIAQRRGLPQENMVPVATDVIVIEDSDDEVIPEANDEASNGTNGGSDVEITDVNGNDSDDDVSMTDAPHPGVF